MITPEERRKLEKERDALLAQVDAIEEYLEMPRTADIRRFAKEKGYYVVKDKRT
jgi:hypothetical protein